MGTGAGTLPADAAKVSALLKLLFSAGFSNFVIQNRGKMFKRIVHIISRLILRPAEGWRELDIIEEQSHFLRRFFYPLIAFVSAFSFVAVFFSHKSFDVELAFKHLMLTFCMLFGGLYLSAFLLSEITRKFFGGEKDFSLFIRFSGYSYSLLYVVIMVVALLPELVYLYVAALYTAVIAWEGSRNYLCVEADKQVKFTVAASIVLLLSPYVVVVVLKALLPGLQV